MITNLLSRYHPRYMRALIYMLQANEYYPFEYLSWYHRTQDFTNIEKRKKLVFTVKAILLSAFAWGSLIFSIYTSIFIAFSAGIPGIASVVLGFLVGPFIVPYSLFILILVLNFLQKPIEGVILALAKRRLAKISAVRIAIAGSFGKTSMREILKTILQEGKRAAGPGGSHNTPLAIARFVRTLKGDEEILVFEFGEYYPGDILKLCAFVEPEWGVITGVNEAHLERFGTLEKAADTIFELADHLNGKILYVNGEATAARGRAEPGHIVYDKTGTPSWRVVAASTGIDGTEITFDHVGTEVRTHTRLLGMHNVGPLAAAADMASRLGLTDEEISRGINATQPFEHRMEPRAEGGVTWIDDSYNGNPDGVAAAIDFLKMLPGRRFYVTPGLVEMGSRKAEIHREMGRKLAEAKIEKVVLIRNSVTPYIEEGLKGAGYAGEIIWFDYGPTAFTALPTMTVAGDVILIQNDWPDQYE